VEHTHEHHLLVHLDEFVRILGEFRQGLLGWFAVRIKILEVLDLELCHGLQGKNPPDPCRPFRATVTVSRKSRNRRNARIVPGKRAAGFACWPRSAGKMPFRPAPGAGKGASLAKGLLGQEPAQHRDLLIMNKRDLEAGIRTDLSGSLTY